MEISVMQRLRDVGLSIPQFDLLSTLTEGDGMTQKELASRLYVTKGNVSGLVDRLAALALVERHPVEGDKRSHTLALTPKGRELAETGIRTLRAYVDETLGLMEEKDRLELDRLLSIWRDRVRNAERSR